MALGSVGGREGRVYTSLGSSSWIAVNTKGPVLDFKTKPYVFAHIQENMYTSAFSIFAGGSSFRWVRDTLDEAIESANAAAYDWITLELAEDEPAMPPISDESDLDLKEGEIVRNISVNIRFYEGWDE